MKKLMAVILLGAAMFASGAARAEPLVLMTWGGVWQKTFQELAATYKEKTGKEVTIIAQGGGDAPGCGQGRGPVRTGAVKHGEVRWRHIRNP